ncbi:hypothetical protein Tco_1046131 [Tanacetum coccineum]
MTDIGSDIFHTKVKEFAKFLKDKKTTSGHVVAGDDLYFFNDGISGLETTWFPHTTDCVILLAVYSGFKSGRKLLSWRRFDGDCRDSDDCANLPGRICQILNALANRGPLEPGHGRMQKNVSKPVKRGPNKGEQILRTD